MRKYLLVSLLAFMVGCRQLPPRFVVMDTTKIYVCTRDTINQVVYDKFLHKWMFRGDDPDIDLVDTTTDPVPAMDQEDISDTISDYRMNLERKRDTVIIDGVVKPN